MPKVEIPNWDGGGMIVGEHPDSVAIAACNAIEEMARRRIVEAQATMNPDGHREFHRGMLAAAAGVRDTIKAAARAKG